MAETNDQDEPHIPTSLILRMTARLWRLPLSIVTRMSAERVPASMRGGAHSTITRYCGHQQPEIPLMPSSPARTFSYSRLDSPLGRGGG